MANFTINGDEYKSKVLDGRTQILLTKRLVGVLALMASTATALMQAFPRNRQIEIADIEEAAGALQPIAQELAKLKDEDVDFLMNACMGVTEHKFTVGAGWAPVIQNGVVQNRADDSFLVRLSIVWYVLQENYAQISALIGLGASADTQPVVGNA